MTLPNPVSLDALFRDPHFTSLLANHPNDLKLSGSSSARIPDVWNEWWDWAGNYPGTSTEPAWVTILRAYCSSDEDSQSPLDASPPGTLQELLRGVKDYEFNRTPCNISEPVTPLRGMSPKKSHEVIRMTAYVKELLKRSELTGVKHVVDVGAGQGYLSRALCDAGLHVLAIDGDDLQTEGAEKRIKASTAPSRKNRRGAAPPAPQTSRGTLTHKTAHITPEALEDTVSSWIEELDATGRPIPVFFVALHACGSLTPDIFRTFLSRASRKDDTSSWTPAGACIVGCCYNLMSSAVDFPLSKAYGCLPHLSETHLQMAAQMPARWLDTSASRAAAELAIRKLVYRALLEAHLPPPSTEAAPDFTNPSRANSGSKVYRPRGAPAPGPTTGSGTGVIHRRLGKLPDSAYTSFTHFLGCASERLGVPIEAPPEGDAWFRRTQSQVEVLHVLRCIMGPSIESAIVADRVAWLREALDQPCAEGEKKWEVELVSLFDQAAGSARNFAVVVD